MKKWRWVILIGIEGSLLLVLIHNLFFPETSQIAMTSTYFLGIVVGVIIGNIEIRE